MNRTTFSRHKRWFFSRSLACAYWEWLERRKRRQSVALQRPLFAEALEPRVLFSAAPVPAEQEVEAQAYEQQPSAQTAELIVPQALPPHFESGIDGIENVLMEQEDAQDAFFWGRHGEFCIGFVDFGSGTRAHRRAIG